METPGWSREGDPPDGARGSAREARLAALRRRQEEIGRRAAALHADSESYWERREAYLQRAQRGRKLAQLIAHDLKNHLSVAKTNIEYALCDLPQEGAARGPVELAAAAIEQGLVLTAELVAVEQIEAPRPVPAPVRVDLLLAAIAAELAPCAERHEVSLEIDAMPGLVVSADRRLTTRVLYNLAHNAIRHGAATRVRIGAGRAAGGRPVFFVEDDGRETPDARALTVRTGSSTGIAGAGLAFCRAAIEAHGGTLWTTEHAAQGTTVRFSLDEAASASASARAA